MKKIYFASCWHGTKFDDGTDFSEYFSSYRKAKNFIMNQSATKGLKHKVFVGDRIEENKLADKVCFFEQDADDTYFHNAELIYDICECNVL